MQYPDAVTARDALVLVIFVSSTTLHADCNQSRPEIRFAIDGSAWQVRPAAPVVTTIDALHERYTARTEERDAGRSRHAPHETTVYQVDGILAHFEGDWDRIDPDAHYILSLGDPNGRTAIQADLVAPGCAEGSPLIEEIRRARYAFDAEFPAKPYERKSPTYNIPVRVTGVGFLETGYGWRTLRLAPVLKLEFGPPDFGKLDPKAASAAHDRGTPSPAGAGGVGATAETRSDDESSSRARKNGSSPLRVIPWLLVALAGFVYVRWRVRV